MAVPGHKKILGVGEVQSDPSLKNARVNVALIVSRTDPTALIPYNYVVFGVNRFEGD